MQTAHLSRSGIVEPLSWCFGLAAVLAVASAGLAAALAGLSWPEETLLQYPNSAAVGLPRLRVPHSQSPGCMAWGMTLESRYATSDRPERVMRWYHESPPPSGQGPGSASSAGTQYAWGPVDFNLQRMPSLLLFENVTQISILTRMQLKLCL